MPQIRAIWSASKRAWTDLATFCREGHREARADLRGNWFLFLVALIWSVFLSGALTFLNICTIRSRTSRKHFLCQPDGSFRFTTRSFNYWSMSAFFQITLGFGNLSFAQAKAIDICWDMASIRTG
jgi:hypothetical protein